MNVAAWNVRTLQDNPNNLERRTAVIAKELSRYNIDIAALQKTHSSKNTDLATHFFGVANQLMNLDNQESALQSATST